MIRIEQNTNERICKKRRITETCYNKDNETFTNSSLDKTGEQLLCFKQLLEQQKKQTAQFNNMLVELNGMLNDIKKEREKIEQICKKSPDSGFDYYT